jgi:hypothetical protein
MEIVMKTLTPMLLLLLLAGGVLGQDPSNPAAAPGLAVLEKKWRSQVRNPALDEDPLLANEEQRERERDLRQNQRDNAVRARLGLPQQPPPLRIPTPRPAIGDISVQYIYQAKVRNTGTKEVRKLVWDYVFLDASTQAEVGRRRIENKISIRPGKSAELITRTTSPPTGTVSVKQIDKKMREQYAERVEIQRIEYADGSVWERGSN